MNRWVLEQACRPCSVGCRAGWCWAACVFCVLSRGLCVCVCVCVGAGLNRVQLCLFTASLASGDTVTGTETQGRNVDIPDYRKGEGIRCGRCFHNPWTPFLFITFVSREDGPDTVTDTVTLALLCVCVCLCVRERERTMETEIKTERNNGLSYLVSTAVDRHHDHPPTPPLQPCAVSCPKRTAFAGEFLAVKSLENLRAVSFCWLQVHVRSLRLCKAHSTH